MEKYLGGFHIDQSPEPTTITALVLAAEAHYRISVLEWRVRELAAGRSADEPPPSLQRDYWAAAYDRILHDVREPHMGEAYIKPMEFYKAQALAAVKG